jgi:Fe-S oxidoreductase
VATAKILNKAGVDYGILGAKENCCGESIRKTGNEELFKRLARENIKTFIDNGVKKILVSSPHCYHTFKNEYPEFMVNFEVVHISQYLCELIDTGRLSASPKHMKGKSPITIPAIWGGTTAWLTSPGRPWPRYPALN